MVVVPPKEVHEVPIENAYERLSKRGYDIPGLSLKMYKAPEGGMFSIYEGHPVPRKGLPYIDAVFKNNEVKAVTMAMFTSFGGIRKGIMGFLNTYLANYCKLAESIYYQCERVPLLKREYYCTTSRGLWDVIHVFLREIGIDDRVADRFGQIIGTVIEYDDAYRLPVVDVMSEFTKEEIVKSPGKFVKKFVRILAERSDNNDFIGKFKSISTLIRLALWVPKYRKAFRKAFNEVDLSLLQYDKYDSYWVLHKKGYNFKGRTIEDRYAEMEDRQEAFKQYLEKRKLETHYSQLV